MLRPLAAYGVSSGSIGGHPDMSAILNLLPCKDLHGILVEVVGLAFPLHLQAGLAWCRRSRRSMSFRGAMARFNAATASTTRDSEVREWQCAPSRRKPCPEGLRRKEGLLGRQRFPLGGLAEISGVCAFGRVCRLTGSWLRSVISQANERSHGFLAFFRHWLGPQHLVHRHRWGRGSLSVPSHSRLRLASPGLLVGKIHFPYPDCGFQ